MTVRFDPKDPAEDVTMEFDFAAFGTPTSPIVEAAAHSGTDASPSAVLLGSPTVIGTRVLQRARDGLDGVDYSVRCIAIIGSDTVLIDAILPVRQRPSAAG